MADNGSFDYTLRDSQATPAEPVAAKGFDFDAYREYEENSLDFCRDFFTRKSGVAVYRRMRVAEVFADGCADMKRSLELQLGGLQKSLEYCTDIPNFLEPWYGIGTAASAFGFGYIWKENLAPALQPGFPDTASALRYDGVRDIKDTPIGKHTLRMVEYFMEQTRGRLPLSICDVQSPLNTSGNLIDINNYLTDTMLRPELFARLLDRLAGLIADFAKAQVEIIGDRVVWPGHGFASSRVFRGFGASDDNILLVTPEAYRDLAIPSLVKLAGGFGGPAFHSCGDWSTRTEIVRQIPGLQMADGAFTRETDPDPNPPEPIRDAFRDTGIILCARMVGNLETVRSTIRRLWAPGLKLIAVTYCRSPEEQARAYDFIHEYCV